MKNPILQAIEDGDPLIDFYLESVTPLLFKKHIEDLRQNSADQEVVKGAITELSKLLKDENKS